MTQELLAGQQTGAPLSLGDVIGRLWSRRWVVIAGLVLGSVGGSMVGNAWPASYTATALLQVSPITSTPFGSTPASQQVNIETERNVMASPEVAIAVIDASGIDATPYDLLEDVTVSNPPDSLVLRVSFTSGSPQRAAEIANTFAEQYLTLRSTRANQISEILQEGLEEQIRDLTDGVFGDPSSQNVLTQTLELRQEQARLAAVGVDPGSVIGRAEPPTQPSSPGPRIFLAGGGALGLLMGLTMALVIDVLDPRAHRPRRVANATGSPVLVARDLGDEESMLRLCWLIVHHLDSIEGGEVPTALTVVGPDRPTHTLSNNLAEHLRRTGRTVHVRLIDDADDERIDLGFPTLEDKAKIDADLLLLDASAVSSRARQTMLTSRGEILVLVSRARTRLAALENWTLQARTSGVHLAGTWFQRRLAEGQGPAASSRMGDRSSTRSRARDTDRSSDATIARSR